MSSEHDREFEQNVSQLIQLLRKLVKNLPSQHGLKGSKLPAKDSGVQIHINFFSFFPMTSEEWEAIEDMYDSYPLSSDDKRRDFAQDLSADDREFLRRNGIRF